MNKQELVTQGEMGTVYILHLDSKLNGTAGHYIGWARELENRLYHHRKGSGARFTRAANIAGIQYSIAADWPGTRNLERAMKNAKNHKLFCPICMGEKAKNPLEVKWRTHTKRNKAPESNISLVPYNHIDKGENVLRIEKSESGAPYTEEWRDGQRRILVPTPIEGVKMDVTDLIGKLD